VPVEWRIVRQNLRHRDSKVACVRLVQKFGAVVSFLQGLLREKVFHQICLHFSKVHLCLHEVDNIARVYFPYVSANCVGENELRAVERLSICHNERRVDCAALKQVWVIANFPQLHQHIHD